MARIVISPPTPMTQATAASANALFSPYATLSVDATNVGQEGIDLRNISTTARPVVPFASMEGTDGTTASYQDGYSSTYTEVTHGGGTRIDLSAAPLVLAPNDLIRIYINGNYYGPTTTVDVIDDRVCWLLYPTWDQTSAALTTWQVLPGCNDPHRTWASLQTSGILLDASTCFCPIPLTSRYFSSSTGAAATDRHYRLPVSRGWRYINTTGSPITIYGIRMEVFGPFVAQHYDSGVGFEEDVFQAAGGVNKDDITLGTCSLIVIHHTKGR